jgi:hypothetical protein
VDKLSSGEPQEEPSAGIYVMKSYRKPGFTDILSLVEFNNYFGSEQARNYCQDQVSVQNHTRPPLQDEYLGAFTAN